METEKTVNKQFKIHVVGCGGAGFWTALGLTRCFAPNEVAERVIVYDTDNLQGGLGHSRLPVASPQTLKVDLLRGFIRAAMGDTPPTVKAELFTGDEPAAGDLVVDCSDMATNIRKPIWAKARAKGARCLRISYDGAMNTFVIAEGLPLETAGPQGGVGYANVPSMALSLLTGGAGATVISKIISGEVKGHVEFQVSIDELLGLTANVS